MANLGRGIGGAASGAATGAMAGSVVPGIGNVVGGIIGGVGGLIGGLFSGNDSEEQMAALQQEAMDAIRNVDIPRLQQLQVQLQQYREAGMLTPELEQTVYAPESMMAGVSTDPRLKDAQMNALTKLQGMSTGGLNMSDMSMMDQIRRNTDIAERGKEQQILQDMQQRGQSGSGAELAARLSSSQNAANRSGAEGLQVGATATQRALESLMNSGQLGGQMRTQEFGEQSQKAQAQDVINQFNTRNRQAVIGQNVAAQNAAEASNLSNKQDVMNRNTNVANQQQEANVRAAQQDYENRMNKAKGIYGANTDQAKNLLAKDQRGNEAFSGTMSGLSSGAAAFLDMMKKKKDETTPFNFGGGGSGPGSTMVPGRD